MLTDQWIDIGSSDTYVWMQSEAHIKENKMKEK